MRWSSKEVGNREEVAKFMEAVDQFERIINDDDRIRLIRMTEEELVGTKEKSGLLDRYFSLSDTGHASRLTAVTADSRSSRPSDSCSRVMSAHIPFDNPSDRRELLSGHR